MSAVAKSSKTARAIARLKLGGALTVNNLHGILVVAAEEGVDVADFADVFDAAEAAASDEVLGNGAIESRVQLERLTAGLNWIRNRFDSALFNRAVTRRQGDESAKVSIPHEHADIELVPEFAAYSFDVDALETVLPYLKEAERPKLLKIVPEREESILPLSDAQRYAIATAIGLIEDYAPESKSAAAIQGLRSLLESKKVERCVSAGATVSITSIADRYRGSNVETLIRSAMKRDKVRDKLIVKPRVSTELKTVQEVTP